MVVLDIPGIALPRAFASTTPFLLASLLSLSLSLSSLARIPNTWRTVLPRFIYGHCVLVLKARCEINE